jgi:predicted RNase H-like HicB family nuclease
MKSDTVIVHEEEEAGAGYWAEVEELPGCFASALTLEALEDDVKSAIEQHIAALQELGELVPEGKRPPGDGARRWLIAIA